MRDILTTLKNEHDQLRDLFGRMNATTDEQSDTREDLLKEIENLLIPHAKWEELHFYPAFADRANHDQLLTHAEAIQEHRAVEKAVLPDLHAADLDSRQFAGSAKALGEMIRHHAHEEETSIFEAMRQLYSARELADMDEQYEDWKASSSASAAGMFAKAKTAASAAMRNPDAPG